MTTFPNDLFVMLVVIAMAVFSLVLGYVSITDRDAANTHPAE
ncbi:MAG: hypothetical protein WC816_07005 [Sphingomonas sp.]|jgi:hypothetical protein